MGQYGIRQGIAWKEASLSGWGVVDSGNG